MLVFRRPFESSQSITYLFEELFKIFTYWNVPVKIYKVPFQSKGLLKRLINTAALVCFQKKVVHITGDIYYVILGCWFSKRVITIHDLSFLHRTRGFKHFILKWFWVKLPCLFAHKVTVISQATRDDLLNYVSVPDSRLEVIYDFVDDIFQPVQRTFNEKRPVLLQIGCAFNKNLENLIRALEGLSCELIIIGRLSQAQATLLHQNNISYKNAYDLPLEVFHKNFIEADILCYVSTVEGFGMPIIEAQASGLLVVTSNCSSMPEIAGNAAVFVDPYDIASIRKGILKIISQKDTRELLMRNGYINVKRFSKEKIALKYIQLYESFRG